MKKFFKDLLTGADNDTFDIARLGLLIGILVFNAATFYALSLGTKFDWVAYGGGLGAILGLGGAGVGVKAHAEPKASA